MSPGASGAPEPPRLAVIGLGALGAPVAGRLVATGEHRVVGYDLDPARADAVPGLTRAASPTAAARGACIVLTCLPTSADVAAVVDDVLPVLEPGALLLDLTSGEAAATRALGARLAARGVRLVDAAVTGGVARAATGDLAVLLGGAPDDVAEAIRVLAPVGSTFLHGGPLGAGQMLKSLNNLVSATGLAIAGEALRIGAAHGLAPELVVQVLNAGSGRNHATETKLVPHVLTGAHASGFGLDLMVKDLGLALALAEDGRVETPLARAVLDRWRSVGAALGPGRDHTEIARIHPRPEDAP
ncbi:hypothetical protein GCM10022215_10170 [Nocardioides fonticola]|uniref:NAD(P)-dependent oxidoreductase n=1 Tax=Nocardioides fonticola TaxID=450363 RepID=A0ABP7XEP6_9ACTN